MIEAPIEHQASQRVDIGKSAGVLQRSQRGFGRQQVDAERLSLATLVAHERCRSLALEESNRAAPVVPGEALLLDLWLERKGGAGRCGEADLDLVLLHEPSFDRIVEFDLPFLAEALAETDRELDADGLVLDSLAGPQSRFHSAFGCELARERPHSRGLQQL
jgi:hypothetical protein